MSLLLFVIKVCAFPISSSSTKFFLNVVENRLLLVTLRYWHRYITSFYQWLQTQRARKTSSIGGWGCVLERSGMEEYKDLSRKTAPTAITMISIQKELFQSHIPAKGSQKMTITKAHPIYKALPHVDKKNTTNNNFFLP